MNGLEITVTGAHAQLTGETLLTGGMVGLPVCFLFDESWDGLKKTAVFRAGGKAVSCLEVEDQANVPWEVMAQSGCTLEIGVYGANDDGTLVIPTVWVTAGTIQPGADPSEDLGSEPAVKIWELALEGVQQAKAVAQSVRDDADRGLFRGEQGERGDTGVQGPQGKQGVQGPRGYQGARGEKGDRGATGADGHTPVLGVDYWTEADKAQVRAYVDEAILGGAW